MCTFRGYRHAAVTATDPLGEFTLTPAKKCYKS